MKRALSYNNKTKMKFTKHTAATKAQLRKAALLLRFRSADPGPKAHKYMSYRRVAAALRLHEYEVQHICRKALKPDRLITAD